MQKARINNMVAVQVHCLITHHFLLWAHPFGKDSRRANVHVLMKSTQTNLGQSQRVYIAKKALYFLEGEDKGKFHFQEIYGPS